MKILKSTNYNCINDFLMKSLIFFLELDLLQIRFINILQNNSQTSFLSTIKSLQNQKIKSEN
jgi:hypothetical protein